MSEITADFDIIKETLSKLGIGAPLSIGFNDLPQAITSSLVGMEFGKYIIITPPDPISTTRTRLFQENKIVIRFLYKGQVMAFPSEIVDYMTTPQHLVFIKYPKKIIHQNIRTAKRIECMIPARTFLNDKEVRLVITDISQKGCGLLINLAGLDDLKEISLNTELILQSDYLLGNSELHLRGVVKNARKKQGKLMIGLQFAELDHRVKRNIDDYNLFLENFAK